MTDRVSRFEWLRNGLLGVITSVMLILIGYLSNDWWSRDHLSIEYVRFVPMAEGKLPTGDFQYKLHRLHENPQSRYVLTGDAYRMFDCTPFANPSPGPNPNFEHTITSESKRTFQICLENSADELKLNNESLQRLSAELDKNPSPSALDAIVSKLPIVFYSTLNSSARMPPDERLKTAKNTVKTAISDSAEAELTIADLLALAKQITIIRTGSVSVVATIRNTGDTDGLVMASPDDYLILNKNEAKLPLKMLGTSYDGVWLNPQRAPVPVVAIPKRGAVTVEFLLDPSVLPEPPRVAINALLKQSQYPDLRGKVILRDTRNHEFESKEFDFPVGNEE